MCPDNQRTKVALSSRSLRTILLFLPFLVGSVTAQTPPPASEWLPADAIIALEVHRPKALIECLASKEMAEKIASVPVYREQLSNPKFAEFLNVIQFLEASLGTDWPAGLAQLTGGGIAVAVCPNDTIVAVIDSQDEGMLEQLHQIFLSIARSEAEKQGHSQRIASKEYGAVTAWTFDGKEAHAILGRRLLFSNRAEALKAVLDRRGSDGGPSLADRSTYQAARRAVQADAVATAFVDLKLLVSLPPIARLLEGPRRNPLAALAFSGISESIRRSNWLAVGLAVEQTTFTLGARTDGTVSGPTSSVSFALPQKAGDGARPNLSVPGRIAGLSLYRDLHGFYAAKDTLFPERSSGLIFFENMMGIFFTGRDLTSEVLAEAEPEVRVVVARQQYDPAVGTPKTKLPAFAVIFRLRRPQQFGAVMEEAWQKAVGLINFTRGQQALPGLIIDRPIHAGTKFTVAYFSTADVEDKTKLDTRFNIRPSLAMPGDYLVLSSTDGLARDLIDALGREGDQGIATLAQTHSVLEFDGAQAASVLKANREAIVRKDMIDKGRTYESSKAGIDLLLSVVELIDQAKLNLGTREGLTHMGLQVKMGTPRP